jgi:ATP-dependent helicase/nuclease subunit B
MVSDSRKPNLYTIPSGTPFLDVLAKTLLDDPTLGGTLGADVALEDLTILLPTRRSVRALGDAFLRVGGAKPLLLPHIRPLGDVDEEELVLTGATFGGDIRVAEAIDPLERQLRLSRLILDLPQSPAEGDAARALGLAADLGRFLDMVETERVDLKGLSAIVPDDFAENWQLTIEFLKLITAYWPDELARLGLIEASQRRNLLLDAETASLKREKPKNPIIAAGSTGSIPATAALLETILGLSNGAVVLPGLDLMLDDESFDKAPHAHPQYGLRQLLAKFGASRKDVSLWPGCEISDVQNARARFLSEAMRPAETTEKWQEALPTLISEACVVPHLSELFLQEIETFRAEAEVISMLLREAIESPGKTAALITPDRGLARRVAIELKRWGIEVNDSAGRPLAQTPPLTFLTNIADMVGDEFSPIDILTTLKHPLARMGRKTISLRSDVRELERAVLRGPRLALGLEGLQLAVTRAQKDKRKKARWRDLEKLVASLEKTTKPFVDLMARDEAPFADLLNAHIACAEALAAGKDKEDEAGLWAKDEGKAASQFLNEMMKVAGTLGTIRTSAYRQVFAELVRGPVLRPTYGTHPRLFIWGPLEARLQHADRIVLGGLNEGVWPGEAKLDPWLNRPMRKELGLEPPERRIGLSAHDFVEGASAKEVYLTRALKVDGSPTVASRWLLRLQELVKGMGMEDALAAPKWIDWAAALDEAGEAKPITAPRPTPELKARPQNLSVTEIETLMRDPYAIYAKHVLGLRPLEDIEADVAAAERGSIIHEAMELFVKDNPTKLGDDAYDKMIAAGEAAFEELIDRPDVATFWWPRFLNIAEWMLEFETRHREGMKRAHPEIAGKIIIEEGLKQPVTLRGRADRIDVMRDGTLTIIDYKTGQPPSEKQVRSGLSPQLPLEAAMALRGAFGDELVKATSKLLYLRLSGGTRSGDERAIGTDNLIDETWIKLVELLKKYEDPDTPYLSNPRPQFRSRFAEYDHLARLKEWSVTGEAGE